jgi:hypothetical protein
VTVNVDPLVLWIAKTMTTLMDLTENKSQFFIHIKYPTPVSGVFFAVDTPGT